MVKKFIKKIFGKNEKILEIHDLTDMALLTTAREILMNKKFHVNGLCGDTYNVTIKDVYKVEFHELHGQKVVWCKTDDKECEDVFFYKSEIIEKYNEIIRE